MYIGKKLTAALALLSGVVVGGVVAAAPANASSSDMGLHLITGHNVGLYNDKTRIDNADKGAPDLIYNSNINVTDGIETDCYGYGTPLDRGNRYYHTDTEYYNHLGYALHIYQWTYAPYVDGEAGINAGLRYCNY
ncbi:hypothetical protein [Amycolatopsis circi]|uniref:hypothetical protein n=1 Tax=Amycolatopsis circi TaxID=871959 RepID=UPI000E233D22|nr:hypothetical protein [Amycolatopsis circi]